MGKPKKKDGPAPPLVPVKQEQCLLDMFRRSMPPTGIPEGRAPLSAPSSDRLWVVAQEASWPPSAGLASPARTESASLAAGTATGSLPPTPAEDESESAPPTGVKHWAAGLKPTAWPTATKGAPTKPPPAKPPPAKPPPAKPQPARKLNTDTVAQAKRLLESRGQISPKIHAAFQYVKASSQEFKDLKPGFDELGKFSEEKRDFILQAVASNGNFDTPYFQAKIKVVLKKGTRSTWQWLSWTKLKEKEGREVALCMIEQGTIVPRLHEKLKPDAPSTLALPEEERYQYAYAESLHEAEAKVDLSLEKAQQGKGATSTEKFEDAMALIDADPESKTSLAMLQDAKHREDKEQQDKSHMELKGLVSSKKRSGDKCETELKSAIKKSTGNPYIAPALLKDSQKLHISLKRKLQVLSKVEQAWFVNDDISDGDLSAARQATQTMASAITDAAKKIKVMKVHWPQEKE